MLASTPTIGDYDFKWEQNTTKNSKQGGPAKVKPTYIIPGNIFGCIGKIQWFLANVNYIQQIISGVMQIVS